MLTEVVGRVVRGHGVASGRNGNPLFPGGTVAMQIPAFLDLGLDLTRFHRGTINLSIAPHRLMLFAPRLTFRNVRWHPSEPPEDFSFVDCAISVGDRSFDALIYHPHPETKPTHHQPASVVEVLAPFVPGIVDDAMLRITVDAAQAGFA